MDIPVIEVTPAAHEAGFSRPVYVTEEVWDRCIAWEDEDNSRQGYQEEDARLWDVLFVPAMKLRCGLGSVAVPGGMVYEIYCLIRDKGTSREDSDLIQLRVVPVDTGGGDGLVITF